MTVLKKPITVEDMIAVLFKRGKVRNLGKPNFPNEFSFN